MHRYTPVRSQRSQGVKIKHVLRICFLIVVCCWLIFQIKRSHYKRKDLGSVDTKILSSTNVIDEVVKLGRKDLQRKETETREQEDDDEHEVEEEKDDEEKDDEVDENEQYKFDDEEDTVNESEEKDGESQAANEAREEHYKADDASSAVTHEHEDQTLDYSKFLEMGISEHENQVHNGASLNTTAKIQETRPESANKVNMSSDHGQHDYDSTWVVEESEASSKLTNMSAVVEPQTILTTKGYNSGSLKTVAETEEPDEVQHDAIDSTDLIRSEDLDSFNDGEDTVAE